MGSLQYDVSSFTEIQCDWDTNMELFLLPTKGASCQEVHVFSVMQNQGDQVEKGKETVKSGGESRGRG